MIVIMSILIGDLLEDNNITYIRKDLGCGSYLNILMGQSYSTKQILVSEQDYEKAKELIEKLVVENKITQKECCDMTINQPKLIDKANCIPARYDCGISNQRSFGSGVIECQK